MEDKVKFIRFSNDDFKSFVTRNTESLGYALAIELMELFNKYKYAQERRISELDDEVKLLEGMEFNDY